MSIIDPRENNKDNYKTGQKVLVTVWGETRPGFIAKQVDERHFLIRLEFPFNKTNPHTSWLKVCRDYAHQCVVIND